MIKYQYVDWNASRSNIKIVEMVDACLASLEEYKSKILPDIREIVSAALDAFVDDPESETTDDLMIDAAAKMLTVYRWVDENIASYGWELKKATEGWGGGDPSKFPRNMKPGTWFENNLYWLSSTNAFISFQGDSNSRWKWNEDDDLNANLVAEMSKLLTSDIIDKNIDNSIKNLREFARRYIRGVGKSIRSEGVTSDDLEALAKSAVRRVMRKMVDTDEIDAPVIEGKSIKSFNWTFSGLNGTLNKDQLDNLYFDMLTVIEYIRGLANFLKKVDDEIWEVSLVPDEVSKDYIRLRKQISPARKQINELETTIKNLQNFVNSIAASLPSNEDDSLL